MLILIVLTLDEFDIRSSQLSDRHSRDHRDSERYSRGRDHDRERSRDEYRRHDRHRERDYDSGRRRDHSSDRSRRSEQSAERREHGSRGVTDVQAPPASTPTSTSTTKPSSEIPDPNAAVIAAMEAAKKLSLSSLPPSSE